MDSRNAKQTDPIQDMFPGIKKILEFMEVKDLSQAMKYETTATRNDAEMWMNAIMGIDTYMTYRQFWTISMFQEVVVNVRFKDIEYWINHPANVPVDYRENLLKRGREVFLNSYVEKNEYYRMLNGLPPIDTPKSQFVYLTEPMRNQLHASKDPVHLLSPLIQNNYMCTDEYKSVVAANPDKKYLKYLGLYKVDLFTARKAKDFEIIRYPSNRSDINPNLLSVFAALYNDYREYVMTTLYNSQFEGMYENYRSFMGILIQSFVLLQISNKAVEAVNSRNFLDDSVLHIMLSMHDIPRTLLMTNEVRRNLAINMLKLVRERAEDDVYYDLISILGYHDIIVSKLMLMKGQKFDKDHNYRTNGRNGEIISSITDTKDGKRIDVEPYFIQIDLKDKDPYETIINGKAPIHDYHKIIDEDPTWWDLPDTQKILRDSNYTVANSKYIMIEAVIHQIKYLFESVYFTRMILDNKSATDEFLIEIPEIFGTEMISIYDLMVYIISATCMNNGLRGDIISEEGKMFSTAGFNFDMDLDSFTEFINTTQYVDKERVMAFMENLTMKTSADINRLFNDVMYPMREWLEQKISNASSRKEFIEYESIYRALFTYDATRNSFLSDFEPPIEIIRKKYNLSEDDMEAYKHFYPRTLSGEAITVKQYNASVNESRYKHPFLDRLHPVDWYIHIVLDTPYGDDDRGYVYLHDILNSKDLRELTNPDGTRVFMDWEDGEIGWQINNRAVQEALSLIDKFDEKALHSVYFQVDTPVLNSGGKVFKEGELLPANIRSGIYREILKEKISMDMKGLSVPPKTFVEYLYRKNPKLSDLLLKDDRFTYDKEAWLNDVMRVVLAVETNLNIHMKYLEQSVVGSDLFFKPLITLINHFKSTFVNFAKTGLKYMFADKIDAGGNSNMFKIFDEVKFIVHFVTLANRGYESQFGIYDTEHKMLLKLIMNDRSEIYRSADDGLVQEKQMGSFHLVDEMKFFMNDQPIDPSGNPSSWYTGEPGTGRWSDESNFEMAVRTGTARVSNLPVDLEGWKDFVESYNDF